jgi:hypothetical protein
MKGEKHEGGINMGVTSSGLLDEERDASAASMSQTESDNPENTLIESGEYNSMGSDMVGRGVAGTPLVCYRGPCIYLLP